MTAGSEPLDVLVIGAGQAGLAMGWHLARRGLRFRIVDAGSEVGQTWRRRWDSLKLFTAAQYDGLPGMAFPAPRDTYPGKDDVANFLQAYAAKFELPVVLNAKVTRLQRKALYEIDTNQGPMHAHNVVVATGPFQTPFVPPLTRDLDAAVFQLHSIEYRRPGDIPRGRVLVVGAANTGCQIALELSATHQVEIRVSCGSHQRTFDFGPAAGGAGRVLTFSIGWRSPSSSEGTLFSRILNWCELQRTPATTLFAHIRTRPGQSICDLPDGCRGRTPDGRNSPSSSACVHLRSSVR